MIGSTALRAWNKYRFEPNSNAGLRHGNEMRRMRRNCPAAYGGDLQTTTAGHTEQLMKNTILAQRL